MYVLVTSMPVKESVNCNSKLLQHKEAYWSASLNPGMHRRSHAVSAPAPRQKVVKTGTKIQTPVAKSEQVSAGNSNYMYFSSENDRYM